MLSCDADVGSGDVTGGGGGGGGNLDGQKTDWVYGIWSGTFQNLSVTKDSEQLETSAWLELKKNNLNNAGDFYLKLPQLEGVNAKGSFTDVNNAHLIFKISDSNLSSIGSAGAVKTFDYELANNTLILRNPRLQMILSRELPSNNSGNVKDDNKVNETLDLFAGSWAGIDARGRSWLIKIFDQQRFTIEVREPGKAILWMSGVPRISQGSDVASQRVLVVSESAIPEYIGLQYGLSRQASDSLLVKAIGGGGANDEGVYLDSFVCTKVP